jgi:S-adenosylmethionine decarboxylase
MAFNDTLFQLGMDLTRSSTAQEEETSFTESAAAPDDIAPESASQPAPAARIGHAGTHLIIDLHGAERLTDAKSAERAITRALESLGKSAKTVHVSRDTGGALSGVAVLTVGHLSFQGNPATGIAAIDVRDCSDLDAHAAMFALADAFKAREAVIQKTRHSDVVFLPAAKFPSKARGTQRKTRSEARAA